MRADLVGAAATTAAKPAAAAAAAAAASPVSKRDAHEAAPGSSPGAVVGVQAPAGPSAAEPGAGRGTGGATQTRDVLKKATFKFLGCDGDGYLNKQELLPFCRSVGFNGSSEKWTEEYLVLCLYAGCDAALGIGEAAFGRLLDDYSDEGCSMTNDELLTFFTELSVNVAKKAEAVNRAKSDRLDATGPATPAGQSSKANAKGRPGGKAHRRGNAWSTRSQSLQSG